jgi:hypothetical protein
MSTTGVKLRQYVGVFVLAIQVLRSADSLSNLGAVTLSINVVQTGQLLMEVIPSPGDVASTVIKINPCVCDPTLLSEHGTSRLGVNASSEVTLRGIVVAYRTGAGHVFDYLILSITKPGFHGAIDVGSDRAVHAAGCTHDSGEGHVATKGCFSGTA